MVILNRAYTYEKIVGELKRLSELYPKLLTYECIGSSHDGREIPMIRMGNGGQALICSAGVHGRESVNPILLVQMVEAYADAWQKKNSLGDSQKEAYDIRQMLHAHCILWIPLLNPDGYEIATRGFSAIRSPQLRNSQKIRRIPWKNWKYNARGVDINRNFPSKTYARPIGETPASENETQALIRVFNAYPSIGYMDFHSRGRVIYYYRSQMPEGYNLQSRYVADSLKELSDYRLCRREEEFWDSYGGGNSVHYYSEKLRQPAITIETMAEDAEFPLDVHCQTRVFKEVWLLPLEMLKLCQTQTHQTQTT